MLFELIAVIVAGIAVAGVVLLARRFVPVLPRWLAPTLAGVAMITASISLEYSWFGRTTATLPDGVTVARTHVSSAPWRPWTYAVPYVDRFIAVDSASARTNDEVPGQRMVDVYVFGRWAQTQRIRSVFDCESGRRADIVPGVTLADDGSLEDAIWHDVAADDPVAEVACGEA